MTWTTRTQGIAELRTQMQDPAGAGQRYGDAELGSALDEAVAELSAARPILSVVSAVVDSSLVVRLDGQIGLAGFGGVVSVVRVTGTAASVPVTSWQYFEAGGQHKVALPATLASGDTVEITVRGGYGFALSSTIGGALVAAETNIPVEWREKVLQGAQGYVLELYGAREVGRVNVSPAMQQQTARAAQVKLRDFRQWLQSLPFADQEHQVVEWGLSAVDERTSAHRGFD